MGLDRQPHQRHKGGNLQSREAVVAEIWYNVGVFEMCVMDEMRAKRDEIYAIARKHKAEKLWVFGSCARKKVVA